MKYKTKISSDQNNYLYNSEKFVRLSSLDSQAIWGRNTKYGIYTHCL